MCHLRAPILLAVLVLLATVCLGGDRTEVEIPVSEGGEGIDFFLQVAREYEALRPEIKINLYGDPRIADKVRVRLLEGKLPDATNAPINFWPLIRSGEILPLDQFLEGLNWEGDSTWRNSFLPTALDQCRYNNQSFGIPLAYSIRCIWYNKALFREHHWPIPKTWDDLFALCRQIQRDTPDIAPFAFQGQYATYAQPFVGAAYYHLAGAQQFRAQTDAAAGAFDNPLCIQSLALTQQLAAFFQPGCMGMSHTVAQQQFLMGRTAMVCSGSWLKGEMMGKIPEDFELGAVNMPIIPGGKGDPTAVNTSLGYYYIFTKSKHPREAADFFRYLTSRKVAARFAHDRDSATAVKGAAVGQVSKDMADVIAILDAAQSSYTTAAGDKFPEMGQNWRNVMERLVINEKTPAELARSLEKSAQLLRDRAEQPQAYTVNHLAKPLVLLGLFAAGLCYWIVSTLHRVRALSGTSLAFQESRPRLRLPAILLFTGPAILLFSTFIILPCIRSFSWSLYEWNGLSPISTMQFRGLLNFKRLLFESTPFWIALNHNLFLMFVLPCFVIPISLFLATCISRGVGGAQLFRVIFFFPNLLGGVTVAILWMQLYNPSGGPINAILVGLGFKQFAGFAWLSADHLYWALVPMTIWGACGFNMILFLAAMENIPTSLYEAADIEGASPWRQFWTITLPLIREILLISLVFMIIGGMKAFETIYLLTNQMPLEKNHVIGTRMIQTMFSEFKVGEATAIAVLLFLMIFLGAAAVLRILRREAVEVA